MHYEGNIIRPPSEANSILIQTTVGCSRNKCTFCGTYTNEQFRIKSYDIIMKDIDYAFKHCKHQNRVFLCDGDALIIPHMRLLKIVSSIENKLPWVKRIGVYANAKSLKIKSVDELCELRDHGLKILYIGLESGDNITLKNINKGTTSKNMVKLCRKAKLSGMKLSITVLLGIAGKTRSLIHAKETGRILSIIDPEYVGALSLMLVPGTVLYNQYEAGKFELMSSFDILKELRNMFDKTNLSEGLFHANHASNYLPIKVKFPCDKKKTLRIIDMALEGNIDLRPEYMRGL